MTAPLHVTAEELTELADITGNVVEIPCAFEVNAGRIERAFCPIAQAAVRGDHEKGNPLNCQRMIDWQCGLTGYRESCLFCDDEDPTWTRLEQSVRAQQEAQCSTH